ncbi:MAG: bifunctional riboflavin kinase/FAD synthetase [Butyrivibrio sp.]|nr:bifunctional riboflavin kinase/FAD synthetase [Butyrivibrio sp.]
MRIIEGSATFKIEDNTAVAIGKFDGVHGGHKKLIQNILDQKPDGLKSVIFTFDPSPSSFFSGKIIPELYTKEEKRREFEKLGIDILVEFPLNSETAATSPEDFISKILVGMLNAKYIAAGNDLSFGNKGRGDHHLLEAMAVKYGYETKIIQKVIMSGKEVSSTFVRDEVSKGNMELVQKLLGETYKVTGIVEHGNSIGHTIGFPTVNLIPAKSKLIPPFGVYFTNVNVNGKIYKGLTNIGCKPTVTDEGIIGVETYIYDFDEDIYDCYIEVGLLHHHRTEIKFADLNELKKQIDDDKEAGKTYFGM